MMASAPARRPGLFLIGAMKAGTTSLHDYLDSHPQISMSDPKEPRFFSSPERWPGGVDEYLGIFQRDAQTRIYGESSTEYAKAPRFVGVAARIAAFAPQAKILYLLRDPVERALSHYWFNYRMHGERRPLAEALREDSLYRDYSDYELQLREYDAAFAPEQIRVVTLEELRHDPAPFFGDLFRWLEVDAGFRPDVSYRRNATPEALPSRRSGRRWLAFAGHPVGRALRRLLPSGVLAGARRRLLRPVAREEVEDAAAVSAARAWLRDELAAPVARLEERLGRDFPLWRSLHDRDDTTEER